MIDVRQIFENIILNEASIVDSFKVLSPKFGDVDKPIKISGEELDDKLKTLKDGQYLVRVNSGGYIALIKMTSGKPTFETMFSKDGNVLNHQPGYTASDFLAPYRSYHFARIKATAKPERYYIVAFFDNKQQKTIKQTVVKELRKITKADPVVLGDVISVVEFDVMLYPQAVKDIETVLEQLKNVSYIIKI